MSGFSVEGDGFDTIARAWETAPEMVTEELTAAIYEAELLSQREIVERTPKGVSGGAGLAGSIIAQAPHVSGVDVLGIVGTPLNYAPAVELGSKPHMPPISAIKDWVVHKLGIAEVEAESVAWAIAKKISRKGTKGAHMFEEGFAAVRPQVEIIFNRASERILMRLAGAGGA